VIGLNGAELNVTVAPYVEATDVYFWQAYLSGSPHTTPECMQNSPCSLVGCSSLHQATVEICSSFQITNKHNFIT